jgi:hypothetical protein
MSPESHDDDIPTLTEVVAVEMPALSDEAFEELHAELTARVLALADELLQAAGREVQGILFEHVSERLRERLPDLIDEALRARFSPAEPVPPETQE